MLKGLGMGVVNVFMYVSEYPCKYDKCVVVCLGQGVLARPFKSCSSVACPQRKTVKMECVSTCLCVSVYVRSCIFSYRL